ncbi:MULTISPECIES: TrbM/KikA/MpfK family conjugal transfer protein [unclassified Pseudomonas]|jgi:TrbM.|uniref:TrbM/KikA/MpfK family conjugal transfer protein n=1 Tax=unclassified Pseudomonas TaxID=196821 RepID=UPI000411BD10|nr:MULTISPECIES: TrbM/KikA/MpfK family conjugal transfer protein [unclassified Pseudomonas]SME88657.1 TrbM protein [Pseudomonas sp. LAIL14HWK12:I11]SMR68093.1 TrbM protein [Pseudomonas sp. LAIL14HWK12:I10]SOD00324.1 TrbM protein [Pseudomonas sp. LAIL14HWK12:I8]
MTTAKVLPAVVLAVSFAVALPAQAKDPCATVLCMWGKLKGAGVVDNCSGPVNDYFSIVKKKKGKIKLSQTSDARQSFLDKCEAADPQKTKSINNKFGKVI